MRIVSAFSEIDLHKHKNLLYLPRKNIYRLMWSTEGTQGGLQEWTILNPGNDEAGHSTDGALGTVSTFCQGS